MSSSGLFTPSDSQRDADENENDITMFDTQSAQSEVKATASADSDSEWEYEYDETETETFYVTLDFSSHNGPIRPPRNRKPHTSTISASGTVSSTPMASVDPEDLNRLEHEEAGEEAEEMEEVEDDKGDGEEPDRGEEEEEEDDEDEVIATVQSAAAGGGGPPEEYEDRIQILELHGLNPIIAYRNQIFNCHWADLIGTELLFSKPRSEMRSDMETHHDLAASNPEDYPRRPGAGDEPVLYKGRDFDLLAANAFKIIGRKANLISNSGEGGRSNPSTRTTTTTSSAPPPIPPTSTHWQINQRTNQQQFLEELARIKQRKGESDALRTTFSGRRSGHQLQRSSTTTQESLRGWGWTEQRINASEPPQHGAVQGDTHAAAELNQRCAENEALLVTSGTGLVLHQPSTTGTSRGHNAGTSRDMNPS